MKNDPVQANSPVNKPTLLVKPTLGLSASDKAEQARILSTANMPLEAKSQSKKSPARSGYKTFAYLGIALLAAIFGYQYLSKSETPVTLAAASKSIPQAANNVNVATVGQNSTPSTETTAPAPAAQEAAQIVNESANTKAAQPATPPVASETKLTNALEEGVSPPPAALKKALISKAPPTAQAPSTAQAAPKAVSTAVITEKKPRAEPEVDKDVNLLAAMIAHSNPTTPNSSKPPVAAVKTSNASSVKNPTQVAAAQPEKPVQAVPNSVGTEALLKQCSGLGFFEREVCRIKTCTNKWETDAACKANLSANSNASTTLEAQKR
jgi:hypothetical protein